MNKIEFFTDLIAWQRGHELVLLVYQKTKAFPPDERFGLVSQMRRAAISVTSNIAEGFGRRWAKDKGRFYDMAVGSIYELQNQLMVARDIGLLPGSDYEKCLALTKEVQRILVGLIRSLPVS